MLRNRNKTAKTVVKQEKQPEPAPTRKPAPTRGACLCGGSGWISKTIPASARGPVQYVRTTCPCKIKKP